jgi:hypothetical protein
VSTRAPKPKPLTLTLTAEQAAPIQWFLRHLCFEDFLQSVPPHLPKEICSERAYEIRNALNEIEKHLPLTGDRWMYRA